LIHHIPKHQIRRTPYITNFLTALPKELEGYQVIMTVADSNIVDRTALEEGYEIKEFEKRKNA